MLQPLLFAFLFFAFVAARQARLAAAGHAPHHYMNRFKIAKRQSGDANTPLMLTNWCPDSVWPAIDSQGGTGPSNTGFELASGDNQTEYVSSDWQGRVWGRTNCTFSGHGGGSACTTGDCGGLEACQGPGAPPATLAEFTLNGGQQQTFYDLSLVDGYNLPMAIVMLPNSNTDLTTLDPSTTNPSCVASAGNLAPPTFNPYTNSQQFLGTDSNSPLPFDTKITAATISQWCPWDLQVTPPSKPANGAYPYPDTKIPRPAFDPCYSACAKYNTDAYCCTGTADERGKCSPNYYSKAAKQVCPDAYSYAYDDQDSTFVQPTGGGFQMIFCPGGRSTDIIGRKGVGVIEHT
ncbi:hypothetical protein B0A50_04706 [Salinomyces thailandicus]|uniref:Osmotin, thaumatin-like protein n=1 Tax=Salinomyces thailandicus TaxID=706561 RepID=A0A4U0TW90_9PEZI|nr:hypothetical protein B0A50_04706 [Salinomyces thailandica]